MSTCTVVTRRVWQPWVPHVNPFEITGTARARRVDDFSTFLE